MESTGLSSAEESDSYEKNTISNDYSEFSPYVSDGQMTFCSPDPDDFFALDGTADRITRRKKPPVAAIFIHAGAGYHSTANERIHLEACSEAARVSMKLLKGGRSAIEAVEAAIKVLEDKEITNAGYGSNLAIDGTVECDATLVDHLGRSGACGAVPNIKNPISLAKVILESSSKPLSLRRVPPNLLIGDGAKEYAWESGMTLVPNEWLVSKNARDRYIRWQEDLKRAEGKESSSPLLANYDRASNSDIDNEARRDHANAILTGTWNEGQPDSPANGSLWDAESPMNTPQKPRSPMSTGAITPQASPKTGMERSPLSFLGSSISSTKGVSAKLSSPATKRQRFVSPSSNESHGSGAVASGVNAAPYLAPHDGAGADESGMLTSLSNIGPPLAPASSMDPMGFDDGDEDRITDTVGAIAIDQSGYIAAGSSSGGIGMKHRGRIGPAALVGIGTAVIPAVEEDKDGIAVAAVTSGTGEHMATTVASQKCAERIYHGTRRGSGGQDIVDDDESAILESFILNDFQEHPGVKYSSSAGAIGVMAVKKSPVGYYLYFAHNTDSFALASMGSNDRDPACVMSRVSDGGNGIAQGARKIHIL
ncbi:nucleophile aminohydrolase [Biscogniauxia marginata]|nr:nucleophile aminohydrolase [Biscogniauxia marginata]